MHLARPVFWIGYSPMFARGRPHRIEASAKTTVWLGRVPHAALRLLVNERPEWWQYFVAPAFFFGDLPLNRTSGRGKARR